MNAEEKKKLTKVLEKEHRLEISVEKIIEQIETFKEGIPFIKLDRACKVGDGIKIIPEEMHEHYINLFNEALNETRMIKFVPASGAASRMFKTLLAVLTIKKRITLGDLRKEAEKGDENCKAALKFLMNIKKFAFNDDLKDVLKGKGKDIDELINSSDVTDIIKFTLNEDGLNYANLPKGCIKFHNYPDGSRTAFEEHLVEAINYAAGKNKTAIIHFTISHEHSETVKSVINPLIQKYSEKGFKIEIDYSFQKSSTNTIAVTKDNKPFRDKDAKLVFRPGGHGALLENLNELRADIILIKNIDNVAPDHLKDKTYLYKKILGGYLVDAQKKIFSCLNKLEGKTVNEKLFEDILDFIRTGLYYETPYDFKAMSLIKKKNYLFEFLNRPIRICGMVKNEGEPGGGPFWVKDVSGSISKQVVETNQIDMNDKSQRKILESATHFSPVDFICGVKDYKGNNFNLPDFANPNTGLITIKSKDGEELKALELPGLWNGGMYHWITVFVEVPKITFNPVKEVNDLLKKEHQPV